MKLQRYGIICLGLGHTSSCTSGGQNSLIFLKRYSSRSALSPGGCISGGMS